MRRREALATILAVASASALPGCGLVTLETVDTEPVEVPDAAEALEAVGLPQPDAELTASEGIRASDLDQWSVRVTFTAESDVVDRWLIEAFGTTRGQGIHEDGDFVSQRIAPEEVKAGQELFEGINPEDRSATYAILISQDGTEVLIAAARTAR